jgi:hypothetical protein
MRLLDTRRHALILAAVLATTGAIACSPPAGRDALAMRATVLGHVAAPAGSLLVTEYYEPAEKSIDVDHGSVYTRSFVTNTPDQFAEAIADAARAASYDVPPGSDRPLINYGPGWIASLGMTGQGVSVRLVFFDLDSDFGERFGSRIDKTVWRFIADLQIAER